MKKALPIIVYTLVLVLVTGMIASGATLLAVSAARVDQVQQYIEEHFTQELTVTGLAERFFISPCHLTHSFKEQVGYSPKQYLRLLRLAYAKELMETTDLPVAEAAVRAGFADVNHFIRSFRETYGVPPGKWRNRDV